MGQHTRASSARRICVIGRAGSGKTTTAIRLGAALDIPVVHLDLLYWTSDWEPVQDEDFEAAQAAELAGEAWILDGGYMSGPSYVERVRRADLVVITEAPLVVCVFRVLGRALAYRNRPRADRPYGANEAFSLSFLLWILRWRRRHPDLSAEIAAIDSDKPIAIIRRSADIEHLLEAYSSDASYQRRTGSSSH